MRIRKVVHFFLMRAVGGDTGDHDDEMEEVRWFPLERALKRAAYGVSARSSPAPPSASRDTVEFVLGVLTGLVAGVHVGPVRHRRRDRNDACGAGAVGHLAHRRARDAAAGDLPHGHHRRWTYRQGGQVDERAAAWIVGPGILGAVAGAALTDVIDTDLLLIVTALLLARRP